MFQAQLASLQNRFAIIEHDAGFVVVATSGFVTPYHAIYDRRVNVTSTEQRVNWSSSGGPLSPPRIDISTHSPRTAPGSVPCAVPAQAQRGSFSGSRADHAGHGRRAENTRSRCHGR